MQGQPLEIVTNVKPGAIHIVPAAILAVLVAGCGAVLLPFANYPLPSNPSFLPAFGALTFAVDLITAILLLGQGQIAGDASALRLGTAYLFSAIIIVPHMAAFPYVMAEKPLLGSSPSAVWLWAFWHAGFALLIVWHAAIPASSAVHAKLWLRIGIVMVAVVVLAIIASAGLPLLPTLLQDNRYDRLNTSGIGPFVLLCNVAAFMTVVVRLRFRTIMALWLPVAMLAACVDVGSTLFGLSRFTLGWYLGRFGSLLTGLCVLGALLAESLHLYARIAEANRYLQGLATTDGLTRIPNRRSFDAALDGELRRAGRAGTELSLLMLDIDWFKSFNDRYGHAGGDECLRRVAATIQGALRRAADSAARYGGEEFAVILPSTDSEAALVIADRIRAAVEATNIPHASSEFGRVTISAGVATIRPGADSAAAELIERADAALYKSKSGGRNRVTADRTVPVIAAEVAASVAAGGD